MNFVMNRNITVTGLSGHSVTFRKGVSKYVPPHMVEECMAKGAVPADGEELQAPEEKEPKAPSPVGPVRTERVEEAFNELVATNRREDFSAGGIPKIKPVRDISGIHEMAPREMKELWASYKAKLSEGDGVHS